MNAESSESLSPSGKAWREWFDRLGPEAGSDLINATANLVIAERDIEAEKLRREIARLTRNESLLLRAVEAACHAWNHTPADYRSPKMQEAVSQLSGAHQDVLRNG